MRRLVVVLIVLAVAGCSDHRPPDCSSYSGAFPAESLRDWKSYADHVAVLTVVGERELPPRPPEPGEWASDRPSGRIAVFRVDDTLWSAPEAPRLPPRLGESALILGAEIGERYLTPLVWHDEIAPRPLWLSLSGCSALRLDEHGVVTGGGEDSIRDQLRGASLAEIRRRVQAQRPDPLAHKFRRLRPLDRVQAVLRARNG